MRTEWDYSKLAEAYLKRPDYSNSAIGAMFRIMSITSEMSACDIGAGVAHLTLKLQPEFSKVYAVEPNDEMRKIGSERTKRFANIEWFEGTGEDTTLKSRSFDIITFGSSFNVCDQQKALSEGARILKNRGWFACMWNHRDLNDPVQSNIENIIKENIKNFGYGRRREDQTSEINRSGLFEDVIRIQGDVVHKQSCEDLITAWKSHASLERQAGTNFGKIIDEISSFIYSLGVEEIEVPYTTRIWAAQLKA